MDFSYLLWSAFDAWYMVWVFTYNGSSVHAHCSDETVAHHLFDCPPLNDLRTKYQPSNRDTTNTLYANPKQWQNKHSAELQQTDPGTKVPGESFTRILAMNLISKKLLPNLQDTWAIGWIWIPERIRPMWSMVLMLFAKSWVTFFMNRYVYEKPSHYIPLSK